MSLATPLDPSRPEVPPLVSGARQTLADLAEVAYRSAEAMRNGSDPSYRLGMAERAIMAYEAVGYVRDLLDMAEQEHPTRP